MREPQNYRANLMQLNLAYPGKEVLNIEERFTFLGISRSTYRRRFPHHPKLMTKVAFAWDI